MKKQIQKQKVEWDIKKATNTTDNAKYYRQILVTVLITDSVVDYKLPRPQPSCLDRLYIKLILI